MTPREQAIAAGLLFPRQEPTDPSEIRWFYVPTLAAAYADARRPCPVLELDHLARRAIKRDLARYESERRSW